MIDLRCGDCLELMKDIPSGSIDLVLTDPPYGITACKWDSVIPFEPMWEQLNRIIKPNGAICLFGREPFTSCLIMSNIKDYKHKWVWNKKQSGSPFNAKYMPLQIEEDIICFCKGNKKVNYYPQMRKGKMRTKGGAKTAIKTMGGIKRGYKVENDLYFPVNILEFANCRNKKENVHPTQKPVDLLEYLIRTYTNKGETVLDFTMGSGSTGVACIHTERNFIGIELNKNYFEIAKIRIEEQKMVENEKRCVCGNKMTKREYTNEWVCHKCGRKRPMEQKKTNADKIRSMTDEELGEFLYLATRSCNEYECEKCPIGDENCPNMISWLQQESD